MYLSMNQESLFSKYTKILIVVAAYWYVNIYLHLQLTFYANEHVIIKAFFRIISIFTVFVNKALLSSDTVNLDAPLFVTWFQCLLSALICFTFSWISDNVPGLISFPSGNPLCWSTFRKVSCFQ